MSLADEHVPMEAVGGYIECSCAWPTKAQWEAGESFVDHIEALTEERFNGWMSPEEVAGQMELVRADDRARASDEVEEFRLGLPLATKAYTGGWRSRDDMSWVLAMVRDRIKKGKS